MTMPDIEQVTDPICRHGEGPVWSDGGLHWIDLTEGDVLALDPDGQVRRWHVAPLVTAIRPRRNGGLVLALERSFALADGWGAPLREFAPVWPETDVRFNDGGCDPQGNFLCGSMGTDYAAGRGALFRLAPDGSVHKLFGGLGVSNGLDWTVDGGTAYLADTLAGTIDAFDHDAQGGLHNRRPFVRIDTDRGMPDGLAVDTEGYVWVTLWNGGAVHRYAPSGRLDAVLEFGVKRVSACTFGGPRLDQLYVTTIGADAAEHEVGRAGAVFKVDVGVQGQPVRTFAG